MWFRSAAPTSAGTGTKGTPAIRQPVTANTVAAVGVASTATRGRRDPLGHRCRGPDQIAARHRAADADGIGDIGVARTGFQRRQ